MRFAEHPNDGDEPVPPPEPAAPATDRGLQRGLPYPADTTDQDLPYAGASDLVLSHIRTGVPYVVAAALAALARHYDIVISDHLSAELTAWVVVGLGSVYYGIARVCERARRGWLRAVGRWMLAGVVRQPVYTRTPVTRTTIIEPTGRMRHPQ